MAYSPTTSSVRPKGFTIIELMIVIVVIGILATLVFVGYSGVEDSARTSKMQADMTELRSAIILARQKTGKTLGEITGIYDTAWYCEQEPDGTDLAQLPPSDQCWTWYISAMQAIEAASHTSGLETMRDPWGRPYFIDENEGEYSSNPCREDLIGAYPRPFVNNTWTPMTGSSVTIPFTLPACT